MELVAKITAEEAMKMYYQSKKHMEGKLEKARKLTINKVIFLGIITWGMLSNWNVMAYAKGSETSTLDLWTKGYSIKQKIQGSKSIQQFPKDVVNLATAWREIPKTSYNVGQDEGTIPGVTLGLIKGTTTMVKNISKGMWQSLNSDKDQKESKGLVFSYKF